MLTQVAKFSPQFDVPLANAEVDVRGKMNSSQKYGLEGPGSSYLEFTYTIDIESSAPPERVRELVAFAERHCHTSQTVQAEVPVTVHARLNGSELPTGLTEPHGPESHR